ncbi:MAG: hypothetical protein CVU57_19725 [Deltaproteobacteria bacterium HGW-Deltaproteobacteria-15]|nr:MAG: hypothetical protein CVU57_19725 [Deltaproteobacteria bacterium HGW-Deltaproteobacteria-15]
MTKLHVLTRFNEPKVRIWRDQTDRVSAELAYDVESRGVDSNGLRLFEALLDHQLHEKVHVLVHNAEWESKEHAKTLPRTASYRFPPDLWFAEGATRVLAEDPFAVSRQQVRIHLITAKKYRGGRLYLWTPGKEAHTLEAAGVDETGPYFDAPLEGRDRHLFLFKFVSAESNFEPDYANRLWSAHDGEEIWSHSQSASISTNRPEKKKATIHVLDFSGSAKTANLHVWQEDSDFAETLSGTAEQEGWIKFEPLIYTERAYGFMLHQPAFDQPWEHSEARRSIILKEDGTWTIGGDGSLRRVGGSEVWTLEGDHHLFGSEPTAERRVSVEVAARDPRCGIAGPLSLDVWVNRARTPFRAEIQADADGKWSFRTFPEVVTSFRFKSGNINENINRHYIRIPQSNTSEMHLFAVLGRADTLSQIPVKPLFLDPPFSIIRPGVWVVDGFVRFAVHCPTASSVEVIGEWTDWQKSPQPMRSTTDGTYWWGEIPIAEITEKLSRPSIHGTFYKYVINQLRMVQDPAADWVENSDPQRASRLVDHGLYQWKSSTWQRPDKDYFIIYQLHPSWFTQRTETTGLDGITREIAEPAGYLNHVGATALLLMPTCEFAGDQGWGYNPSFFYSVESTYGGPDALKRVVDACHERGVAVLLDVVFNHAGTSDNTLWSVARESFFDGDTEWGAMINFDHPQVIHFFEQNLVHFMKVYRVDGFRFDFTRVIRFGNQRTAHVRQPGSGGGWEFLHHLRAAVHSVDGRCILMAENLPNDWDLTRYGGSMDTQWCDNFHDRLVDASRGMNVMGDLADAMTITHAACDQWYESTNYPESHDEVGNEPNRISSMSVGGIGQGLRRNKVAGAAALLSRGIPLWFMGAESGEWRQFPKDGTATLDLDHYEADADAGQVRRWWNRLCELRRSNNRLQGPSPITIHFAQDRMLAFSRGDGADLFVILNFGDWSGWRPLSELNLPQGVYKELLNSTWGDYRVGCENEDEHSNGGWTASLHRHSWLNIPDYGVVVLEKR